MMADDGSQLTGEAKTFTPHRRLDLANEHDFQLGAFRVRPAYREVRRGDVIDILEPRVMQVLAALARRMGAVVSRDELLRDCWGDVSVTDDSLHRCIGRLRKLAESDGGKSFVIETVARVGYRLVAVGLVDQPDPAPSTATLPTGASPRPLRGVSPLVLGMLALVVLAAAGGWMLLRPEAWRVVGYESAVDTRHTESNPALSAAGGQLAYASGPSGARDLFVRNLADGSTALLVGGPGDDVAPAWSPSGDRLAFVRQKANEPCEIIIRTLPNGPERRIAGCQSADTSRLAWAPDGKRLYFVDRASLEAARRIFSVAADGGAVTPVTAPPAWSRGDGDPIISPDSQSLAFVRTSAIGVSDVYVQDVDGGEPRRVTFDGAEVAGLAWSRTGKTLFFSSNRIGDYGLWSVPAAGGDIARLGSGIRELRRLSGGPDGALAMELVDVRANLAEASPSGRIITDQTGVQWAGDVSSTGALAFVSDTRSDRAIWVRAPGQPDQKVTTMKVTHMDDIRWSPDGRRLVFIAATAGVYGLYEITATGGPPRLLMSGPFEMTSPTWVDGQTLILASKQDGTRRLWRLDVRDPKTARPISGPGWMAVRATSAGLLGMKESVGGIWRIEPGGRVTRIVDAPSKPTSAWMIRGDRQYWIDPDGGEDTKIMSARLDGGDQRVAALAPQATNYSGLTFEPTTGALVYTRQLHLDSDIGLMRLERTR